MLRTFLTMEEMLGICLVGMCESVSDWLELGAGANDGK